MLITLQIYYGSRLQNSVTSYLFVNIFSIVLIDISKTNIMIEKKDKAKTEQKPRDDGIELENQFILRIPEEAATLLHEILITPNGNLKDRMTIKLDADLRYGEVRLDHWLLYGKMVDLPTIIECQKTIDSKSFYKSADICQMVSCKRSLGHICKTMNYYCCLVGYLSISVDMQNRAT